MSGSDGAGHGGFRLVVAVEVGLGLVERDSLGEAVESGDGALWRGR